MHRSMKAALLSGLVFPGVGQLYLGRHLRGCVFLVPTLAAALYFASTILEPVMAIALQVQSGAMALDPVAIEARLHQDGQVISPLTNVAALVMFVGWVASVVDAWLAGRKAAETAPKPASR